LLALTLTLGACAAEDDSNDDAATTVSTTVTSMTTDPSTDDGSAEESTGSDGGSTDPTADPTADPTEDPTADPTEDPTVDPSSSSGGADESTGGVSGHSISGNVSRAQAGNISPGDDGVGTLYVGLLAACDQDAASLGGTSVLGANLSQVGSPVAYTLEGLPNGTYYVAGFLDDDVNADPLDPYADMGDLAFAEGFGVGCVEVVIADADATGADFQLNINVPF
jgi:hypothetical protein